jgi:signal peptidase I
LIERDEDTSQAASATGFGERLRGRLAAAARLLLRVLWEIVSTAVPAILITLFINTYVAEAITVDGPSMKPSLYPHQHVILEKTTYRFFHGPRRGDVVVLNLEGEEVPLIKRVVALAGETVEVRGGKVFIDGQPLEEPWATQMGGSDHGPTYIPALHVFVLGDNRPRSRDSRSFGPVSMDQIVGRAVFVYWPLDEAKALD